MRIGIIINESASLANWQLRILKTIIENLELHLVLFIKTVEVNTKRKDTALYRYAPRTTFKKAFSKRIFNIQRFLERKFLFDAPKTVDQHALTRQISAIPSAFVQIEKKNLQHDFANANKEELLHHQLDVIINLEPHIFYGNATKFAKKGIWTFQTDAGQINDWNIVGFKEVLKKEPVIKVSLKRAIDNQIQDIDHGYFNRHWSIVRTNDLVLESMVSLLLKNLRPTYSNNSTIDKQTNSYSTAIENSITTYNVIKYSIELQVQLLKKVSAVIASRLFGKRYYCFTLFLGKNKFLNTKLEELKPVNLPKGEFWADPFLFRYDGELFVFFENYSYKHKRGKISCGKINNTTVTDVVDVLELDYHLSFPYIFEENGTVYLMPETSENKRLEIYRCIRFPNKWELFTTAFEGELVADAFFFNDEHKQKWLFVNKAPDSSVPLENELHIFKVDSIKLNRLEPHKQNPVLIDSRTARNAGAIFNANNTNLRPSQSNVNGYYGRNLNINAIHELTIENYKEETIKTIRPVFHKGLIATHHLHQIKDYFVLDGAYFKK